MADLKQFKLPDVGEGLTEADIVKWHVQPGDRVEVNQTIIEIETAKALVELPCPYEGLVVALHVDEGTTVDVGTPIISVDVSGDVTGAAAPADEPVALKEDLIPSPPAEGAVEPGLYGSPAPKTEPKRQPVLVGYGVKPGTTKRRPRKKNHIAAEAAPAANVTVVALAKPPVRKLAKDLGVDLTALMGSGPQGSITRDDVQAAASTTAPTTAPPVAQGVREERIPIRGVLKNMAAASVQMAFTAPHVTEFLQVDVTETMGTVRRLRELPELSGTKVSPLLLAAKALLLAVRRHPLINSAWDEAAQEVVVKHYVNLGIAAATERGLIVPNIKDAQDLSLPDLARALTALTETARSGKTPLADLQGGTITITNIGVLGVDTGTPILAPGEATILAVGQIRDLPWVHEGEIKIRKVCTLALSFDHRIVDGELGSMVIRDVGSMLEDPTRMLAWG